jgi:hypothetical protein
MGDSVEAPFTGHVSELVGDFFADANFVATTVAYPSFGRDFMGNFHPGKSRKSGLKRAEEPGLLAPPLLYSP